MDPMKKFLKKTEKSKVDLKWLVFEEGWNRPKGKKLKITGNLGSVKMTIIQRCLKFLTFQIWSEKNAWKTGGDVSFWEVENL